jgi:hypothetical protein
MIIHPEFIAAVYGGEKDGERGDEPMAALSARSEVRELNPALGSIGELKNVIAHSVLEQRGFSDVVNTQSEVAGNRSGCRLSVIHLHIADRSFWRVVMCACDDFGTASAAVNEVADTINGLKFF